MPDIKISKKSQLLDLITPDNIITPDKFNITPKFNIFEKTGNKLFGKYRQALENTLKLYKDNAEIYNDTKSIRNVSILTDKLEQVNRNYDMQLLGPKPQIKLSRELAAEIIQNPENVNIKALRKIAETGKKIGIKKFIPEKSIPSTVIEVGQKLGDDEFIPKYKPGVDIEGENIAVSKIKQPRAGAISVKSEVKLANEFVELYKTKFGKEPTEFPSMVSKAIKELKKLPDFIGKSIKSGGLGKLSKLKSLLNLMPSMEYYPEFEKKVLPQMNESMK